MKRVRSDSLLSCNNEEVQGIIIITNEESTDAFTFSGLIPDMYALICALISTQERAALALTCRTEYNKYPGNKKKLFADCMAQLAQDNNFIGAIEMAAYFHRPTLQRWVAESEALDWSLDSDADNETRDGPPSVSTFLEAQCQQHFPPMACVENYYMCFARIGNLPIDYVANRDFSRKLVTWKYHGLIPLSKLLIK